MSEPRQERGLGNGDLLALARETVRSALSVLEACSAGERAYRFAEDIPREVKAAADRTVEDDILRRLAGTNHPVLSEESGEVAGTADQGLRWIIHPIDGTVNFVRRLAPCAVSIALWRGNSPVFGVIGEHPSGRLAWGGPGLGTFVDGRPVRVSTTKSRNRAILCTGFPSSFDFGNERATAHFLKVAGEFAKVRMLGTAALSLMHVAGGSADAYSEQDIMFWDVAAGLALVEGAGGSFQASPGSRENSLEVFASNGLLKTLNTESA